MRAAIVFAAILATAGGVAAEPVPPRARALAAEGRKAHAAGDYAKAAEAFERAYVLAPSSPLLFNIAQAYRLAGKCENAMIMYRRFLESGPSREAATVAGVHLRSMERCTRPVQVPSVAISAPPRIALPMAEGTKSIVLAKRDEAPMLPHKMEITALAISGAAALGVSLVYALDAKAASDDVEAMYARGAPWSEIAPTDARGKHDARVAIGFGLGGLIAIGGAVGLYMYDKSKLERGPQLTVANTDRGRGAQVGLSWAF